jgi:hypothetical protein
MSWIPNPQRANGLSHYDITSYSNLSSLANVLHARTLPGTEASVYDSTSTHIIIRPRYPFRILLQRYSLSVEGPSCCQLLAARPSIILRPSISSDLSHRFQIITPYTPVGDALSTHTYVCPASRKHASGNHGPTFDRAARFGKRSQG